MAVWLFLSLWLLAAVAVGGSGLLVRIPPPGGGLVLLGLTAGFLALCTAFKVARARVDLVDLRVLVLLHATRLAGVYFLIRCEQGDLPYVLAAPSGWSEITVAISALLATAIPMRGEIRMHVLLIWNTVGLTNLFFIGLTFVRIGTSQPWQLSPFQELPLSLFPTFMGPLYLATHVIIYTRLRLKPPETADPK